MAEDPPEGTPPPDPPLTDPPPGAAATEAEWKRLQAGLAKANTEAKTRREELAAARKATEDDAGKAAREAAEAAEKRFKPVAVRSSARAAFIEAGLQGVTPERVAKLVRMLDLDALDVDDTGEVTGLAEQVAAVKGDYPELFKPVDKRTTRITPGDRPAVEGRTQRVSDIQAAQILGLA
jgi:hypothetical protein